jgi:membrane protease YdiL (CAAX protease family)
MIGYLRKNIIPLIIESAFISAIIFSKAETLYLNFGFYLLLILYFAYRREYSFSRIAEQVKQKKFWKDVFLTILILCIGYFLMLALQHAFPKIPVGAIKLKFDTPFKVFLFAVQTIFFPPLAEEMFYRKYLIAEGRGVRITVLTLVFSSVLFAAEHAIYPFGIATYTILGIAFGLAYLRHKNIEAMMAAHFIVNLIGNGVNIVLFA